MQRHYVYPDAISVYVSGGGDGLVESLRAGVGVIQHDGSGVLHSGLGAGTGPRRHRAADQQHRSRRAVHQSWIHRGRAVGRRGSEHGRTQALDGQPVHRAVVARSVKYEDVYLNDYGDGLCCRRGLWRWFENYNAVRPHQSLGNATPAQWYRSAPEYGVNRPPGRLCEAAVPTATSNRRVEPPSFEVAPPTSSKTELENRPPTAVEKWTQNRERGRRTRKRVALSFPNDSGAQRQTPNNDPGSLEECQLKNHAQWLDYCGPLQTLNWR